MIPIDQIVILIEISIDYSLLESKLLYVHLRVPKTQIEPQQRVFVVKTRATRRWKALMPYFKMNLSKKYLHTSGTL